MWSELLAIFSTGVLRGQNPQTNLPPDLICCDVQSHLDFFFAVLLRKLKQDAIER